MGMSGAYTGPGTDEASQYIRTIHPALAERVSRERACGQCRGGGWLGHLAAARLGSDRRGRAVRCAGGVPVDRRRAAAPRLRRRDRLPPGRLNCLR